MKKQTACLCLLLVLMAGSRAQAEAPPHIDEAHIGLPGSADSYRSRSGTWAPVYVKLRAGSEGNGPEAFRLAIETTDGDDVPCRYTTPVPALKANEERTVLTYVRPGSDGSTFTLELMTSAGKSVQSLARPARDASQQEVVGPNALFTLVVGARLPGLTGGESETPAAKDADHVERIYAFAERVEVLPDQWLGYDGVDVVILTTGDGAYVRQLLDDRSAARREALREWVRRGGRLVVSVGHNTGLAAQLLDKMPLFACTIKDSVSQPSLPAVRDWARRDVRQSLSRIDVARLRPGKGASVLLRERTGGARGDELPLLVEGACGRGRAVLAAFDLDLPPISTWEGQQAFGHRLLSEVGPRLVRAAPGSSDGDRELASELKRSLETFAEVPTISFGWVAFFILLYIIVIGPLDYILLKKLFNRLEMTWLTFPTVVVTLCVVAYFTASYLKGDDLRINKVDVVDVDLHGARPQVYGSSWLSLFSPHMHAYTIGLVPDESGWGGSSRTGNGVTVAVMDGPERTGKRSAHSLFHRPYEYTNGAQGLVYMPVSIWATRTFQASWHSTPAADRPPIEAKLSLSRDGQAVVGKVINHLPVELHGVVLFYKGKWYSLPNLVPEESFRVERLFEPQVRPRDLSQWFQEWAPEPGKALPLQTQVNDLIKPLLFHAVAEGPSSGNSTLRFLDEAWRLKPQGGSYRDEVILVVRTAAHAGAAEEVTARGGSPSRLWLDAKPGADQRPRLAGSLNQVTYVRAFIPVASKP